MNTKLPSNLFHITKTPTTTKPNIVWNRDFVNQIEMLRIWSSRIVNETFKLEMTGKHTYKSYMEGQT